ncbi:hypothetical protein niasHS_008236 [Heterodera schachtii]|uniref:RUN and TBC1 domain-containing protein 3 n=1 Tax=Heterodera schachtii TaxID=97005 RepID=A0ABD2IWV3_HETSC
MSRWSRVSTNLTVLARAVPKRRTRWKSRIKAFSRSADDHLRHFILSWCRTTLRSRWNFRTGIFAQETENNDQQQQQTVDPTLEKPPLESSSHRLCDGWHCDYAKLAFPSGGRTVCGHHVQIERDLLRTLPAHFCFGRPRSVGIAPLRRVLRALAFLFPEIGYCQGMAFVVASLLLVCCEENTFWMMCSLIEDILPASFYAPSLLGVRADERVLRHLIQVHMPELTELLAKCNLDTSTIFINWLITLLASVLSPRLLLRVWDHLFIFGSTTVFRAILALLKLADGTFVPSNASNLLNQILRIPSSIERPDDLLEMSQSFEYSVTDHLITELRKKYQGILMAEIGLISNSARSVAADGGTTNGREENLPKQTTIKRKLHRSKSVVRRIFDKKERRKSAEDDLRTKNIRQTELVLDLRNAILQICAHFAECQEPCHRGSSRPSVNTQADYATGFDLGEEHAQFLRARHNGGQKRRARALINFDQRDDDDLGFRKNQLITIVSEKDEHCWLGELDGRRGWFPAQFVKVIDERGTDYCARGDEMVCARIAELVRGPLAFAFHQILCHGLRSSLKSSLWSSSTSSSSSSHPWTFIEALCRAIAPAAPTAAGTSRAKPTDGRRGTASGNSSKLTLCNTFGLDQDGQRVLGPEELLHVAVRAIHRSHSAANAPADAKLRSLVAFGLNEQCLHLWFHIFCHQPGQDALRQRHFRQWSFIRSPLKLLGQLAFNLDVDSELVSADELLASRTEGGGATTAAQMLAAKLCVEEMPSSQMMAKNAAADNGTEINGGGSVGMTTTATTTTALLLRDGVQDMLIKHHLFSWDL